MRVTDLGLMYRGMQPPKAIDAKEKQEEMLREKERRKRQVKVVKKALKLIRKAHVSRYFAFPVYLIPPILQPLFILLLLQLLLLLLLLL